MSGPVDVYMGRPGGRMLTSTLARGRAAITVCPGVVGIEEVLLVEDRPQHVDADWVALAGRGEAHQRKGGTP